MKNLFISLVILVSAITTYGQCCDKASKHGAAFSDGKECTKPQEKDAIKAYYFHATRRCATCQAVEEVTAKTLKDQYGDKIKFESINIEKEGHEALIEKYKISGQTLIFVKGNKTVDLTNDAFLNARANPEKLKEKIKKTVEALS